MKKDTNKTGRDLMNADYIVWHVSRAKKRQHDREITRAYNMRARQRPETKH